MRAVRHPCLGPGVSPVSGARPAHLQSSPSGGAGAALDWVDPRAFEQPILESEALLLPLFMLQTSRSLRRAWRPSSGEGKTSRRACPAREVFRRDMGNGCVSGVPPAPPVGHKLGQELMHTRGGGPRAGRLAGVRLRKSGGAAGKWWTRLLGGPVFKGWGPLATREPLCRFGSSPSLASLDRVTWSVAGSVAVWPGWVQRPHCWTRIQSSVRGPRGKAGPSLVSAGGWGAPRPGRGRVGVDLSARQGAGVRPTAAPRPCRIAGELQAGPGWLGLGGTSGGSPGCRRVRGVGRVWRLGAGSRTCDTIAEAPGGEGSVPAQRRAPWGLSGSPWVPSERHAGAPVLLRGDTL